MHYPVTHDQSVVEAGFQGVAPVTLADISCLSFTPVSDSRCTDMAGQHIAVYLGGCGQGNVAQYTVAVPLLFGHGTFPVPESGRMAGTNLSYSRCGPPFVSVFAIIPAHAEQGLRSDPEILA